MNEAVEILVPLPALTTVKESLGSVPPGAFHTHPSQRAGRRLIVSPLSVLHTPGGRSALEGLLRSSSQRDPVGLVLFAIAGVTLRLVVVEALTRMVMHARYEPYIAPNPEPVRRIILAQRARAQKELIASAALEDGKLIVWTCEPRRLEVPTADIPVLAALSAEGLAEFELSPSGSRIRWPSADVDLNLDTIREYADPAVRREHEVKARKEAARYASAIRRFRVERGLKQTDIAGLTERQVRRLEAGDIVPHAETLKKLAAAHGVSMDEYLKELAKRSTARNPLRRKLRGSQR